LSEQPPHPDGAPDVVDEAPDADDQQTGHAEVDAVVASLRELPERPIAEHVAVFESAHDRLRAALADAADGPAGA